MATIAERTVAAEAVVPLVFPFTRSGYRHVLLGRIGLWCVVERTWIEDGRSHLPHYEVVRLRRKAAKTWADDQVTAAHEAYPAPSDWGTAGWTEPTLVHARQRWERLRTSPKGKDLPAWCTLGIPDDEEGYRAWKAGRLPLVPTSAPTRAILAGTAEPVRPLTGEAEPAAPPA
jgi:hypothetical protein